MSLPVVLMAAASLAAADTTTYVVLNHGRPAGDMTVVRRDDSVLVRYQHIDRNRGQWSEARYRVDAKGVVLGGEARPFRPGEPVGAPTDRFEVAADSVRWGVTGAPGTVPSGAAKLQPGSFYRLRSFTPYDLAMLARHLLAQPERTATLLPTGTARAEIVKDTTVRGPSGRERVRMVAVYNGTSRTPQVVWLDSKGDLVASEAGWFITVRPGWEGLLPAFRRVELALRDRIADSATRELHAKPMPAAVLLRNGDVFDSERGVVRPRTSVLLRGDRIVAVGPADSITLPVGALEIDATGKTIVPGLWDMHGHIVGMTQTQGGLSQLAVGVTTMRDLAADIDMAVGYRDRVNAGKVVGPRAILGGFIEGPGAWAGPSEVLVRTEDEARRWVARYDSMGYEQIKLYNIVHPDLVPTIAEEARKRGMRLSGHIPRGLSVPAAVQLGFDEVNHGAFLFSTFYQDSLYLPRMRAYSAVAAAVAPNIDVDGADMTRLIEFLKSKGTVIDGTFNLWLNTPGADAPDSVKAAAASANANYHRLVKRLFDAGVTMVPGTDNVTGSTYVTELEVYEKAGVPAPEVLRMATLTSAKVMGDDGDYGSIAPGKVADLVIVDGKPAERIGDLRKVDRVVRAGRVYTPAELLGAAGLRQRATAQR